MSTPTISLARLVVLLSSNLSVIVIALKLSSNLQASGFVIQHATIFSFRRKTMRLLIRLQLDTSFQYFECNL